MREEYEKTTGETEGYQNENLGYLIPEKSDAAPRVRAPPKT